MRLSATSRQPVVTIFPFVVAAVLACRVEHGDGEVTGDLSESEDAALAEGGGFGGSGRGELSVVDLGGSQEGETEVEYALVTSFSVNVYEKESTKSRLVGTLRKGSRVPFLPTGRSGGGCEEEWVLLPKGGGYVCRGHGIRAASLPLQEPHLHSPWYDSLLPYEYGRIGKDDLPAYSRWPSAEEMKQVNTWLAERRALLTAQLEVVKKAMEEGKPIPNPYEPIEMTVEDEKGETSIVSTQDSWTAYVEEGPVPMEIPFSFVEKILLRGFFVSIGGRVYRDGQSWIKTLRGHLVPAGAITPKYAPPTRGIELGIGQDLPVVLVKKTKVALYKLDETGSKLEAAGGEHLKRFDAALVLEKLELGGVEYLRVGPDRYVKRSQVTLVEKSSPPPAVKGEKGKWIDIDISKQVLTAYEGTKAVYVALVSTGKEREDEEFKTPRGIYTVQSKHVTGTMADMYAADGPYMIEDVPWTMYFYRSYALHGAFWHNSFGSMRSHGCVNLPPFDARWLFYWADPYLPEGWHSVYSSPARPGTLVKIHD